MQKAGLGLSKTLMLCTILPLSRSTQTAQSEVPSSGALVIQICLPQSTGEDHALPSLCPGGRRAVFQRMFSFSLQCSGRFVAVEWPSAVGPRKEGQLSSARRVGQRVRQARMKVAGVRGMSFLTGG